MLRYIELKEKSEEFLAATGLTDEEFQTLLPTFEKCYQLSSKPKRKTARKKKQRAAGGGRKAKLSDQSDKLLFVLIYQKTAQLQTIHGLQFDLSQPQTRLLGSSPSACFAEEFERDGNETGTSWAQSQRTNSSA